MTFRNNSFLQCGDRTVYHKKLKDIVVRPSLTLSYTDRVLSFDRRSIFVQPILFSLMAKVICYIVGNDISGTVSMTQVVSPERK